MGQLQSIILAAPSKISEEIRQPIGTRGKYPGYKLTFQDNFQFLNEKIWTSASEEKRLEVGFPEYGGTDDLQCYIDDSIWVQNGQFLNIDTHINRRHHSCPNKKYTSGRLTTFGKLSVRAGSIVEASIKFPTDVGMFPAFWLLPNRYDRKWPLDGEIDVMEFLKDGTNKLGTIHLGPDFENRHWSLTSGKVGGAELGNAFHTFTVKYDSNVFKFYMDGILYTTVTKEYMTTTFNVSWPFDKGDDYFIILNAAVGADISRNSRMSIDWLSIYTKQ